MKSQICYLCHKDFRSEYFHTGAGGDLVRFADFKPLPEDAGGQPRGTEWFCTKHVSAAQGQAHLSSAAALSELQARFGEFPTWEEKPLADPSLWVTAVGENPSRVFAVLRRAVPLTPAEAKKRISEGTFQVLTGWPVELEKWKAELIEAGASVEIRFD